MATLNRTLTLRDLILIVIGTVIGSGIFLVPGAVLRQTGGSVGVALLVWLAAGVLSLLGALTYGEMGAAKPDAGGLYVYLRDALGPLPAFLYGWTMFFVMATGSCATLAVAFTNYLGQFVALPPIAGKAVSILMIFVVMVINVRGTRQGANVQGVATAIKVAAILVMSVLLIAVGHGFAATPALWPAQWNGSLFAGIGLAMIGVLWAYEGWQYVTFSAGETKDPQRIFPLGIGVGTALLIGIYVIANVGYVAALGADGAMKSERIAAEAMGSLFGPAAGKVIAAIILVSMFSAANGLTLTAPRLFYSMSRDGVFFAKLAEVHPRFNTPAIAIVTSSVWAMILAATGTFEQLLTYVVFVGWIFYALGALAIFAYRRREPELYRPFRTPGYPVTPILFVLSAAAIVINTVVTQPRNVIFAIGLMVLGIPAYYMWRSRLAKAPPDALASPGAKVRETVQ
ncbi:MAG TPA: amino acid permease [Gemmatimonadaceae bacterium]|nr:amino acid permease [Gemmatimonadaceae bacterium]